MVIKILLLGEFAVRDQGLTSHNKITYFVSIYCKKNIDVDKLARDYKPIQTAYLTTGVMLLMQVSRVNTRVLPQVEPALLPTSTSTALQDLRNRLLNSTGSCNWPLAGTYNVKLID